MWEPEPTVVCPPNASLFISSLTGFSVLRKLRRDLSVHGNEVIRVHDGVDKSVEDDG